MFAVLSISSGELKTCNKQFISGIVLLLFLFNASIGHAFNDVDSEQAATDSWNPARSHWSVFYSAAQVIEHPTLDSGVLLNRATGGVGNLVVGFSESTGQEAGISYTINPNIELWVSYYSADVEFGSVFPLYNQTSTLDIGKLEFTMVKSVLFYGEQYFHHKWQTGLILALAKMDQIEITPEALAAGISGIEADDTGGFIGVQLQYQYAPWSDRFWLGLGIDLMLMGNKPTIHISTEPSSDYESASIGYVPMNFFVLLRYSF